MGGFITTYFTTYSSCIRWWYRLSKGIKKVWLKAKLQRCLFYAFQQVKRYTTIRPKTIAGCELYGIARDLLTIHTQDHAVKWVQNVMSWKVRHRVFYQK